jgi:hypothetical protein
MRTISGDTLQQFVRYGWCCQNHPEYREYEHAQVTDLLGRYDWDAVFYDMIFWPIICGCEHCRRRYRDETGKDFPETVDWTDPRWCEFQSARERWSDELAGELAALSKSIRPGIEVYHNLAPSLADWYLAQPVSAAARDDFIGGDLYGDRLEQLVVSKLLVNLTENRPAEFMTSRCVTLADHVRLKSPDQMRMQALAATAHASAFLFIDAVDPRGTINPAVYTTIGEIFRETQLYEPYLGGEPIEDVGVYFSVDSQMDFAENGSGVAEPRLPRNTYPHLKAVRGVCRVLQREHVPFGVITRRQLDSLNRYRVIVLPNVLRMSTEEADAFRRYVRGGGCVYASRFTSLVSTDGTRHDDFQLADVFGCSFDGEELGKFVYLKPADPQSAAPQDYVSQEIASNAPLCGVPRIADGTGDALATLTLPYGYPSGGSVLDHKWSSIHSSPPWEDTEIPVVVRNSFGEGFCVYSAFEIESVDADVNARLFAGFVRSLLGSPSFEVDAHPAVWASATDDGERVVVSLLHYPGDLPALPTTARVRLSPPDGKRFTRVVAVPGGDVDLGGPIDVERLTLLVCAYE